MKRAAEGMCRQPDRHPSPGQAPLPAALASSPTPFSLLRSACHIWGERPYNTGDLSSNVWWLALPTFGEAW